ncbi:MAG: hypothetical protein PSV46_13540 [Reyranella sp.]|nr:hypothetical protein [Reyranella sp.]
MAKRAKKKKSSTIAGAVRGAVAGLKNSVVRAEIAVVRAGNKAVKVVQRRVDAGILTTKKKVVAKAKKAASKTKSAVRKAAKKVTKKATPRAKRR